MNHVQNLVMEQSFWLQRWEKNEIGFHRSEINSFLGKYGEHHFNQNSKVLVPLCGKSLDLLWLAKRANLVTGVEVSSKAIESFFVENGLDFRKDTFFYSHKNIVLLEKNLFDITVQEAGNPNIIYDRASIVALPTDMRKLYAEKMISLNPDKIFLITLEYIQGEPSKESGMGGPPFSVTEEEINHLYSKNYNIEKLETFNTLDQEPRFRERGMTSLYEKCYLLERI